jgi:hypothetical protein
MQKKHLENQKSTIAPMSVQSAFVLFCAFGIVCICVGLINSWLSRRHAEAPMLFLLMAMLFNRL